MSPETSSVFWTPSSTPSAWPHHPCRRNLYIQAAQIQVACTGSAHCCQCHRDSLCTFVRLRGKTPMVLICHGNHRRDPFLWRPWHAAPICPEQISQQIIYITNEGESIAGSPSKFYICTALEYRCSFFFTMKPLSQDSIYF